MSKSRPCCDILSLGWSSSGRDVEVAIPVCFTLRERGYSVIEESIFNYRSLLIKYRPRLLFLSGGAIGAVENYRCAKFASLLGIPVVAYTCEGNLIPETAGRSVWGHNTDMVPYEQLNFQWSIRAKNIVKRIAPQIVPRIRVTGGVGFDRYKIYSFRNKTTWVEKYNLRFSKMIGYAGWGFDGLYFDPKLTLFKEWYGPEKIRILQRDGELVNSILKQLIIYNPDILFLLKEHPGVAHEKYSELYGLQGYQNVLYIKNKESVSDCINSCDIWMAFESTTCLEAWLLNTPTLLINPSGVNFVRSNVQGGSAIFRTAAEVDDAIKSYYTTGKMPQFEAKNHSRKQIVRDTIQWDDGKNHLRAVYYIEQLLKQGVSRSRCIPIKAKMGAFVRNAVYQSSVFMPALWRFRVYQNVRARFDKSQLAELYRRYTPYLTEYHKQNQLSGEDILELNTINISDDRS